MQTANLKSKWHNQSHALPDELMPLVPRTHCGSRLCARPQVKWCWNSCKQSNELTWVQMSWDQLDPALKNSNVPASNLVFRNMPNGAQPEFCPGSFDVTYTRAMPWVPSSWHRQVFARQYLDMVLKEGMTRFCIFIKHVICRANHLQFRRTTSGCSQNSGEARPTAQRQMRKRRCPIGVDEGKRRQNRWDDEKMMGMMWHDSKGPYTKRILFRDTRNLWQQNGHNSRCGTTNKWPSTDRIMASSPFFSLHHWHDLAIQIWVRQECINFESTNCWAVN